MEQQQQQNDCAICFETMTPENPGIKKWKCQHEFHNHCAFQWSNQVNSCPVCRNEDNTTITTIEKPHPEPNISPSNIHAFMQLNHVPDSYRHMYHDYWPHRKCLRENHMIVFIRRFGVVGICMQCRISKCYNLKHPA